MAMRAPRADLRLLLVACAALTGTQVGFTFAGATSGLMDERVLGITAGAALVGTWILASHAPSGKVSTLAAAVLVLCGTASGFASLTSVAHQALHPAAISALAEKGASVRLAGSVATRPASTAGRADQCRVDIALNSLDSPRGHIRFRNGQAGGLPIHGREIKIRLWGADCSLLEGQRVAVSGVLRQAEASQRHCAEIEVRRLEVSGEPRATAVRVARINSALTELLEGRPAHAQALVPGVALGDDSRVDDSLATAMRLTQLTHLIAVSGGHVSIAAGLILALLGRRRPVLSALITCGALVGLIILVGPQASVLRAVIMGFVILIALALRRPAEAPAALAVAVLGTCALNPWLAVSYGFLLSAAATAGILLLGIPLSEHLAHVAQQSVLAYRLPSKLLVPAAQMVAVPLAAQLSCTPILLLFTDEGSVWGVLANALVAPVAAPLTILGLGAALAAPHWPILASVLLTAAQGATWWIDAVARTLASWPGSGIPLWQAGLFSCALLGWLLIVQHTRIALPLAGIAALLAATSIVRVEVEQAIPSDWDVVQCDVGQGSALLARAGGATILVDTGPPDGGIDVCLKRAHVRSIDLLVLSHYHDDHVGGLSRVLATAHVGQVWTSPNRTPHETSADILARLASAGLAPIEVSAGTVYQGVRGEAATVISPDTHLRGDANEDSVVVRIEVPGALLVMGDADGDVQNAIAGRIGHVRTIVVAHHGSAHQKRRLARGVSAEIALISVGENDYGHPSWQARQIYSSARIYDTLTCGNIVLRGDDVISGCSQRAEVAHGAKTIRAPMAYLETNPLLRAPAVATNRRKELPSWPHAVKAHRMAPDGIRLSLRRSFSSKREKLCWESAPLHGSFRWLALPMRVPKSCELVKATMLRMIFLPLRAPPCFRKPHSFTLILSTRQGRS